jgi:hypothetical protein
MKRWGVLTVFLYALILLALTVPVALIGWLKWSAKAGIEWEYGVKDVLLACQHWAYWLWVVLLMGAQALLLLVPVGIAERRPRPRRHLWATLVVSSFLLANLLFAGCISVLSAVYGDNVDNPFEWLGKFVWEAESSVPVLNDLLAGLGIGSDFFTTSSFFGPLVVFWLLWGWAFYHFARADEPEALVQRSVRWLLRGSILELLVAVPCHVVLRCRETCCAQMATFWGIATGLSVMLMAFGPGVFFLFVQRANRLRSRARPASPPVIPEA